MIIVTKHYLPWFFCYFFLADELFQTANSNLHKYLISSKLLYTVCFIMNAAQNALIETIIQAIKFNLLKVCVKIQIKLTRLKFAIYWLSRYLVNWAENDKILKREKIVLPIFQSMERIPAWKIYIQDSGLLSRLKQQPLTVMAII